MSCSCNENYVKILARQAKPQLLHEAPCIAAAEKALDLDLRHRIAWERGMNCNARTSHKPHGKCPGLTFDRT